MAPDDRPITGGGNTTKYTIRLPIATKPLAGEFTVTASDQDPFVKVIIQGPPSIETIVPREDGSFEWIIDRNWMVSIE
jgi:hypothetical protein